MIGEVGKGGACAGTSGFPLEAHGAGLQGSWRSPPARVLPYLV